MSEREAGEREALSGLIGAPHRNLLASGDNARTLADAILAAGYRKAEMVTTVRQLRELPRDTVVLSTTGSAYARTDHGWAAWYTEEPMSDELMFEPWMLGGPFTVVYRPAALGGGDHE